eukprot:scaffold248409_cov63-Cyclotella_meneghiniana.AAC.1
MMLPLRYFCRSLHCLSAEKYFILRIFNARVGSEGRGAGTGYPVGGTRMKFRVCSVPAPCTHLPSPGVANLG